MDSGRDRLPVGAEITFQLNYSALVRAMTSPFVAKVIMPGRHAQKGHPLNPVPTGLQSHL